MFFVRPFFYTIRMKKQKNILCEDCSNLDCFVKKHFSIEHIKIIENKKRCEYYPKKNYLFKDGDDFDRIFFLREGKIKISNGGEHNKEQAISFIKDGDSFGYRGLLSSKTYPVSSQTITDCHVCYVPAKALFDIIYHDPALAKFFITFLADSLYRDDAKLKAITILSVREKVAYGLLSLINIYGLNKANEIIDFEFVTRKDFADLVGLTPNQVTRILGEFANDNIIKRKGKKIQILKPKELKNMLKYYNIIQVK